MSATLLKSLPLRLLKDFEITRETERKSLIWFISRENVQNVAGPSMKWNERGNEQMKDVLGLNSKSRNEVMKTFHQRVK